MNTMNLLGIRNGLYLKTSNVKVQKWSHENSGRALNIDPPSLQVPHLQIQPTIDQKYSEKKIPESPIDAKGRLHLIRIRLAFLK